MHKLSNIRFNADKRDYAHLQIKRMLAAEYDYDTLRIFSSGTDATTGLNSSDISAKPKFAIKSVQGCTLLMMQRSRCAVYYIFKRRKGDLYVHKKTDRHSMLSFAD